MSHQVVEEEGVPGLGEELARGPGVLRQGNRILCRLPVLFHQTPVAPGGAGEKDEGTPRDLTRVRKRKQPMAQPFGIRVG